jgi:hypothetical protein
MHSSLAWIEWLDRLNRVLQSARSDVTALARNGGARRILALERARRQLAALTDELRLLDPRVLARDATVAAGDIAARLQSALDTILLRLDDLPPAGALGSTRDREPLLCSIDAALRDGSYEAASLSGPRRHSA